MPANTTTTYVSLRDGAAPSGSSNGIYMAIGIGVGCAVVLLVLSWYFCCHRPSKQQSTNALLTARDDYSMYKEASLPACDATDTMPSTLYVRTSECDLGPLLPFRLPAKDVECWHVLASGSHGEVYLGEYRHSTVAIKQLYDGQASAADVQRFADEIVTMSRFDHPRIVSLVGVVWDAPPAALRLRCVMEYMDQGNLQDYCSNSNDASFPYRLKARVALQIANALAYIHAIPIVHRDLKSKNVLVDGKKGAKITDFASAKAMRENASTMTQGIGTFRWLAPEVLMESRYSAPADVYSLGVLLAEMSMYKRPYSDLVDDHGKPLSEVKILQQITSSGLRPSLARNAPTWYTEWATACMATEPSDRPTAADVAKHIQAFLGVPRTTR
ncbi:TKL protein kinase [Saprolegnia parasitica CBS 223.65]|uniref:TKL protein kinase n=1 Tax=Saprolegnia parasitica (strain CBS 223.65) TaxID=695850 RepID=A0A067BRF1_SAPPC|nr:TKL protein kinase [Saprolegnia parasitica CBS 223.65]KDO17217.1 TKL protein kinase [Saprolegnia parasitica CBS 223.65]|eukprot:XP_012212076.1 TKL protein kinase [Saprolegnia parasitica CBS 223.65]